MGLLQNKVRLAKHRINNIKHNMFLNKVKVWNKKQDNTVLNGLALWCSGTKSTGSTATSWKDISGYNRHITMYNATLSNNEYLSNGSNTYGILPLNLTLFNTGGTIDIIAKYTTADNYRGLMGPHFNTGTQGLVFGQYASTGGLAIGLFVMSQNKHFNLAFNSSNLTNGTLAYNQITMTYDRNTLSVYVNGVLKQYLVIGQASMGSSNIYIGFSFNSTDNRYFHGSVRDLKIYTRALTATEVLQNYNQNKSEKLVV